MKKLKFLCLFLLSALVFVPLACVVDNNVDSLAKEALFMPMQPIEKLPKNKMEMVATQIKQTIKNSHVVPFTKDVRVFYENLGYKFEVTKEGMMRIIKPEISNNAFNESFFAPPIPDGIYCPSSSDAGSCASDGDPNCGLCFGLRLSGKCSSKCADETVPEN